MCTWDAYVLTFVLFPEGWLRLWVRRHDPSQKEEENLWHDGERWHHKPGRLREQRAQFISVTSHSTTEGGCSHNRLLDHEASRSLCLSPSGDSWPLDKRLPLRHVWAHDNKLSPSALLEINTNKISKYVLAWMSQQLCVRREGKPFLCCLWCQALDRKLDVSACPSANVVNLRLIQNRCRFYISQGLCADLWEMCHDPSRVIWLIWCVMLHLALWF